MLAPLLIFGAVFVGFAVWFVLETKEATREVTSPSRYQHVLTTIGYPKPTILDVPTLGHFPATIPASATNVRFYYRPAYLQGSATLQLRCNLPAAELATLRDATKPRAISVQAGGDCFDALNAHTGPPTASFRDAANTSFAPLPADFEVYVLGAQTTPLGDPAWDHWWSYGIAISMQRSEVVYWAQN